MTPAQFKLSEYMQRVCAVLDELLEHTAGERVCFVLLSIPENHTPEDQCNYAGNVSTSDMLHMLKTAAAAIESGAPAVPPHQRQ